MLDAISVEFPAGTKFTHPQGGLFTWIELDENIIPELWRSAWSAMWLCAGRAVLSQRRRQEHNEVELPNMPEEKIAEGIRLIGTAIGEMVSR